MKTILLLVSFVFLSGCFQSIAFLGPAITGASTGKLYQAGLSYGTNMIMEQLTFLLNLKRKRKQPLFGKRSKILVEKTLVNQAKFKKRKNSVIRKS